MVDYNLLDKSFSSKRKYFYHLSIQADLNGVSFCYLDISKNTIIGLKKFSFNSIQDTENLVDKIITLFKKEDLNGSDFKEYSFLYKSQKSTLVPAEFFNKNSLKKYFEFNQELNDLDEIHYNYLKEIDAYNIFTIPTYIACELLNRFRNIPMFHQATPLISYFFKEIREPNLIVVNVNYSFFDIVVKENSKLKLYNSFYYKNENDLLYFILYVVEQLRLDSRLISLNLCGEYSERVEYYELLKKYFPKIKYTHIIRPTFSKVLKKIEPYKFLNLFYLHNCV